MTLELLHAVVDGRSLTEGQAEGAMRGLLAGESTPVLTAAFLTALRVRGETIPELTGFARAMRAAALPLAIEDACRPILDTCGTGGNPTAGFNISTISAFVVAGAGVRVAKHGNRSITSKSGSADLLEALGVCTAVPPQVVANSIRDVGIGFLFAPSFHQAVRHVQPTRLELKFRTAFNFLGPLTNPARAEMQVAGTWSDEAARKIAGTLAVLGLSRGYVVHGSDGLGEVTVTGPSTVFSIRRGEVEQMTLTPEDFGFEPRPLDSIRGGDVAHNRAMAEAILAGETGAPRDIVLINSALAIVAAGKAADFKEGVARAAESIDSGAANKKLDQLRVAVSLPA
ncbi:MAG: anthranilate phosphoribosyltransferase [Bryobacterales bacterium]|nr:anthranilate phosphoribosyltransferase [Bryobacterales bacterium]